MSQDTTTSRTASDRQWIVPFTIVLILANFGFLWMMATYTTILG